MRIKTSVFLFTLLFIRCTKESSPKAVTASEQNNATAVTTASIPLTDLGKGLYNDSIGGLYPDGTNTPSGTYANDLLSTSSSIVAIDSFGNASPTKGYVVFISVGGSTGGKNMTALISKT